MNKNLDFINYMKAHKEEFILFDDLKTINPDQQKNLLKLKFYHNDMLMNTAGINLYETF